MAPVCLFRGVVHASVLAIFSQMNGVPEAFAGITTPEWAAALDDASRVGLLTAMGGGLYRIHPALPGYLAALWRSEGTDDHDALRDTTTRVLVTAHAYFAEAAGDQIAGGDAALALGLIADQRRTLGHLLGYALDGGMWHEAETIASALNAYWEARGLSEEAQAWVERVRVATEAVDGSAPPFDTPAGSLWIYFVWTQAERQIRAGQPRRRRGHLSRDPRRDRGPTSLPQTSAEPGRRLPPARDGRRRTTAPRRGGGMVPACLRDPGSAGAANRWWPPITTSSASWPRTAVASMRPRSGTGVRSRIAERFGNRPLMASTYHELGMVAQGRGRLDEAEEWYWRALRMKEKLGNRLLMASTYHQLGAFAERRRLDEAEQWYRRALGSGRFSGTCRGSPPPTTSSASWPRPAGASTRPSSGTAGPWDRRADREPARAGQRLPPFRPRGAGSPALRRGRAVVPGALGIEEELGDRPNMAKTYGQLGRLADARGWPEEALEWMVRSIDLFNEFPHPSAGLGTDQLARLSALGAEQLAKIWVRVTGRPLPPAVAKFVTKRQSGGAGGASHG